MKELEITVRLRNNRLKERRETLGMNQKQLAVVAGISLAMYRLLETLRCSPRYFSKHDQCWYWRTIVRKLAEFYCTTEDELFPESILAVETPVLSRLVDALDIAISMSSHQMQLSEGPSIEYEKTELKEEISRVLSTLRPREKVVIAMRFGLLNYDECTLSEVGNKIEITSARVRQIEQKAIRKLRHPSRSRKLREFVE